ncbi:potassium transporter [Nocardia wallacei]|uniref:potassium transporter n=1 Tax=Nocardia wallacei TaxID=480035 RepID=UPI0024550239|nr:potassium transporter [Nocardia wallacei]
MHINPKTETFGADDQSWLASAEGTDRARTITLDMSTFAAGDYSAGYLKSGWTLRKLASGLYGKRSDGDTEGIAGHLLTAVAIPSGETKIGAALLWHGAVYAAKVPNPPNAAGQATAKAVTYF